MPHDPASSLIKTVTGDYGSPMTYKDIVNNKVFSNPKELLASNLICWFFQIAAYD